MDSVAEPIMVVTVVYKGEVDVHYQVNILFFCAFQSAHKIVGMFSWEFSWSLSMHVILGMQDKEQNWVCVPNTWPVGRSLASHKETGCLKGQVWVQDEISWLWRSGNRQHLPKSSICSILTTKNMLEQKASQLEFFDFADIRERQGRWNQPAHWSQGSWGLCGVCLGWCAAWKSRKNIFSSPGENKPSCS